MDDPRRDGINLSLSKIDYGEDWGEDDEDDKEPSAPDKDPGSLALFKDAQGVNTGGDALALQNDFFCPPHSYCPPPPPPPDKEDQGSLALFKDAQKVTTMSGREMGMHHHQHNQGGGGGGGMMGSGTARMMGGMNMGGGVKRVPKKMTVTE